MAETSLWNRLQPGRKEVVHSVKTAIAAVASLLVARLFRLPESYWAPITTLVVMQSTLGASLAISLQRLEGTALGASMGALLAGFFHSSVIVFGAGVLVAGLICADLRLERSAYRYAGITLAIIILVERVQPAWMIAIHRFIEISIGIAVGLAVMVIFPEDRASKLNAKVASA
ncbi:MAG TPA: FUSC family protein [Candidatus Acidoferrales bacterium]|nr:FUSC family protein [Candidatus Acidoferrales bacterium]